jgi:hypothetical protein
VVCPTRELAIQVWLWLPGEILLQEIIQFSVWVYVKSEDSERILGSAASLARGPTFLSVPFSSNSPYVKNSIWSWGFLQWKFRWGTSPPVTIQKKDTRLMCQLRYSGRTGLLTLKSILTITLFGGKGGCLLLLYSEILSSQISLSWKI